MLHEAHSTTQATNALLEGDVAKVGIFGITAAAWRFSKRQSNVPDIDLGTGRYIRTCHAIYERKHMTEESVDQAIEYLKEQVHKL